MSNSYKNISKFYERLIVDDDYNKWINYATSILKSNVNGEVGVDLACGTGIFTRALKKAGFDVMGIDISQEMLAVAVKQNIENKLNIEYLKQDIKNLKLFNKVDFITIFNDGINYLKPNELSKAFSSFKKSLNSGGFLLFDFSSEYKLKNVLANNMFGDNSEDLSYIWFNSFNGEQNSVQMDLTFFENKNGSYIRCDDTQTQYVHTLDGVINALKNANFDVVSITDNKGNQISNSTERIVILAKLSK